MTRSVCITKYSTISTTTKRWMESKHCFLKMANPMRWTKIVLGILKMEKIQHKVSISRFITLAAKSLDASKALEGRKWGQPSFLHF